MKNAIYVHQKKSQTSANILGHILLYRLYFSNQLAEKHSETEDNEMRKLEDSTNLNVVQKRQSKDNHSTTEAQLEVPMEPSSKKDSVSIVSDQVDSVSIVSDPVDQSSGNQSPKLKLKKSRQGRRETKWWSLWKRLKRRKMMILQVQQDSW